MPVSIEHDKKPRLGGPPPLLYVLLSLILLVVTRPNFLPKAIPTRPHTKNCGRIILISAARHGSTWFVDSAEHCTAVNGSYGRLNKETELWNTGFRDSLISDIDPESAALYAKTNRSIKLFPLALQNKGKDPVVSFFEHVKRLHIPVFVLRRNLEHSYDSLALARKTKVWNSSHLSSKRRTVVKDGRFYRYRVKLESFFEAVEDILVRIGLTWDEFDYDDVVKREVIIGERNRCFIWNCNFRRL